MDRDAYVTYHGNTEADREIAQRSVLFIDNQTAAQVLTMEDTIDAVEEAYREYGMGRATATRATHSVPRPGDEGWYTWDPMASALPGMGAMAIRMKSDILPPSGLPGEEILRRTGQVLRPHRAVQHRGRRATGDHERRPRAAHAGGRRWGHQREAHGARECRHPGHLWHRRHGHGPRAGYRQGAAHQEASSPTAPIRTTGRRSPNARAGSWASRWSPRTIPVK